jgi:ligand-binding sensor domain-containing protein/signal transduction histidine kinase
LRPGKLKEANLIHSIYEQEENKLLIATNAGLFIFNKHSNKFSLFNFDSKDPLNYSPVFSICKGDDHNIWVGTSDGLVKVNDRNNSVLEIYHHQFGSGNTLAGNTITSLMLDKSGVLWIGAYRAGVSKLINTPKDFINFTYSPDNKNGLGAYLITFFAQDDQGYIWISGYSDILTRYDPRSNTFKRFRVYLPGSKKNTRFFISSIVKDKNNLWVGTTGGILLFDLSNETQISLPKEMSKYREMVNGNVTYLLISSDNKLWVGINEKGMFCYDLNNFSLRHFVNPMTDLTNYMKNIVQVIYEDKEKKIWAGTMGGLLKLNQKTGKYTSFSHSLSDPKSLSNNYVYYLYEDSRDNFWIGTSNGLNKMNKKDGTFRSYYERDGLPNNVIMSLLEDGNGNFWISTNKGIARFDPSKSTFKNFDVNDGLLTNIFYAQSAFIAKDGMFYFGGNNGFTKFNPNNIKINNYIPPVYLTSIKAGKDIGSLHLLNNYNKTIDLPFNNNFIQLKFAALDYTNPEKNVYKYKMMGVDEEWIYSGHANLASYTDLSPGKYIFEVKGSNSDGIWNDNPAAIEIVIFPPFWRTWWFTTLVIIIILLSIYLAHLMRVKHKIRRALEMEKIRSEENERVRKQTAIDFHDELGHRLTRISLLTEIVKRKLGDGYRDIMPLLRKISENSIQLYDGTKDFIWATDPQNDSLYELLVRLKDFGDEIFNDSNIDFLVRGISTELEKTSLSTDMKRHLTLIFKEGMNNALKHSNSKRVSLESKIAGDEIEITLEDDGSGFMIDEETGGNGIKNMIRRAEKIHGNLQIDSGPGKGTRISFKGKVTA